MTPIARLRGLMLRNRCAGTPVSRPAADSDTPSLNYAAVSAGVPVGFRPMPRQAIGKPPVSH
jgi:hypothetical protein